MSRLILWCSAIILTLGFSTTHGASIELATFQADVTPPVGSPLCGGGVKPTIGVQDPLSARGIILLPKGQAPIVLCSVDWTGIANSAYDEWRETLAKAAGTTADRVAVQALHQHDAPFADYDTHDLLAKHGLEGFTFNREFAEEALTRTGKAVKEALKTTVPVTHYGAGSAEVFEVASNRRILDENGKVRVMRFTACADPAIRAEPVGTIDPLARVIAFWNVDKPVAVLSYYATHPQSYYNTGMVSYDFPGMARALREAAIPGAVHIHFTGAGGNIGAGKWNDGSPENRPVLAKKLADGLKRAWEACEKQPIKAKDLVWTVRPTPLPVREEIDEAYEQKVLANPKAPDGARRQAARELVWRKRCAEGYAIPIQVLHIKEDAIVHMPGELFVEYQIMAQEEKPNAVVATAAYGEYGPGYIGTKIAYAQGGYETELHVSRTSTQVEDTLREALEDLLQ